MFNATRLRRSAILGAIACALLAATTSAVAAAQPNHDANCQVQLGAGLPFVPCYHEPQLRAHVDPQWVRQRPAADRGAGARALLLDLRRGRADRRPARAGARRRHAVAHDRARRHLALAAASIAAIHRRRLWLRRRVARAAT